MQEYQSHTLPNGVRIVHIPLKTNVSYCGFIINTGTRDELLEEYGMAHFVEHMLFKGTKKRRSHHILNRMESVGGDINAFTNKEETTIYSTFLEEDFERAIELLADITFNSVFPQKEIEKEIDVVLDEINSYEDSPSELIFDEFENIIFKGSQLGHNILGEEDTLQSFDTAKILSFVEKQYTSNNIVFFSLGKTDIKKIIKLAEKYIHLTNNSGSNKKRIQPKEITKSINRIDRDTTQTHAILGGRCYNLYSQQKDALHLLNNILGGPGMNSRLNISLREKKGYVYNVESNVINYEDTGLFSIYFGCDKKNTEKCIQLIKKELKKIQEIKLTNLQLATAKKQLLGQIAIASDNHENLALGLGKNFLHYNHFNSISEIHKRLNKITSEQLLEIANDIFREENLSYLIYN